jgi:hypothetical protein
MGGDLEKALAEYRAFLRREPPGEERDRVEALVAEIRGTLDRDREK